MHAISPFCALLLASTSLAQNGLWAQLTFPSSPSARYGSALVYDVARDRLVLVGGRPVGANETWENDGMQWNLRATTGPVGSAEWYPGDYLAGVYDEQRQRTIVVQTNASSGTTRTWEWDGSAWQLRTNGNVPYGRAGFAIAYDSARQRTVMFGGMAGGNHFSDTWEWDGNVWLQRSNGGPAPRQLAAMAFDSVRGKCVLFGAATTRART